MRVHHYPAKILYSLLILALAFPTLGANPLPAPAPAAYQYANGVSLAAGSPLPIYTVTSAPVTTDVTLALTQNFAGINSGDAPPIQTDSYLGYARFTALNEKNKTIFEQYGATGGFYAYQPERAFADNPNDLAKLDPTQAQKSACLFVLIKIGALGPTTDDLTIPGVGDQCSNDFATNPLYKVSTETRSAQENKPGAVTTHTPLRMVVTMPMLVSTWKYSQILSIPLAGPGGHISMIFDDTSPNSMGPSLDDHIVGLQAVAMPAHGRTLKYLRNVPVADPAVIKQQIYQQVRAAFPEGSNVQVPDPELAYYLSDAAEPQDLLEPNLIFSGITVEADGETHVLRDIVTPATEPGPDGLGPSVTILAPLDGALYFPGAKVSLQGQIADGKPPYAYDWQLDDGTSLGGGTLAAPGALPPVEPTFPRPETRGYPGDLTLTLVATDDEGVTRRQSVSLVSPASVFLPVLMRGFTGAAALTASLPAPADELRAESISAINYRFGVEYGADYPPYGKGGSDLPNVPADANGLSSKMIGMGWPRVFNWANSSAWERDWRDCALGGIDCTMGVDRADFVYYAGHGGAGGLSLPSNSHDSSWFDGANARFQTARWVGFASCQTLRVQGSAAGSEPIRRWFNAFRGAHLLLGFNSNMRDVAFGPRLADNMRMPSFLGIDLPWAQRTIAQAWVQTAFELNAGKVAYLYATSAAVNPIGNKLPKVGDPLLPRPTPVNWYYWVWWNE